MDTNPADQDKPNPEAISGKRIDTSSAFGGTSVLGRDAESRLNDLSGSPEGAPEPPSEGADENLQQILGGEVPKSSRTKP